MKQILLLLTCMVMAWSNAAAKQAVVTKVTDGDTFVAEWNGHSYKCRLANVDAPELKQPFGVECQRNLQTLLIGKTVQLDSLRTDMYKRIVVEVKLCGKRLDSLLIRTGFAWHYTAYNRESVLKQCQELAVVEKTGLWKCGASGACPPWLYRKYNVRMKAKNCMGCNSINS